MTTVSDDWKEVQVKTFTNWINSKLRRGGFDEISNLSVDCRDGNVLINLIEVITGKRIMRHRDPDTSYKEMENNVHLLDFLKDNGVVLVNIGPEDLVRGNEKLILGLVWMIVLRFGITGIGEEQSTNAKTALMTWCNHVLKNYGLHVNDFTMSWKDGMAFNAILHYFRRDLIGDFEQFDPRSAKYNVKNAFDVAERELGIPKLMDVEDIVDAIRPDDKSIFTYVSQYYNAFSSHMKEMSSRFRIRECIVRVNTNLRMVKEYKEKVEDIQKMTAALVESIQATKVALRERLEKDDALFKIVAQEILSARALYGDISTHRAVQGIAEYVPPDGYRIEDVDSDLFESQVCRLRDDLSDLLSQYDATYESIAKLNRAKRSLDRRDDIPTQIASLAKAAEAVENLDGFPSVPKIISSKLSSLRNAQQTKESRERRYKEAIERFRAYDKEGRGRIRLRDFMEIVSEKNWCNELLDERIRDETTDLSGNYISFADYERVVALANEVDSASLERDARSVCGEGRLSMPPQELMLKDEDVSEVLDEDGNVDLGRVLAEMRKGEGLEEE